MADVSAQKKTVAEERIEVSACVCIAEGKTQIIIELPEAVPAGKELMGTLSLKAQYQDPQNQGQG